MAVLAVPPSLQFFDANGDPLSGGFVYTYAAGTTTPKATYTDSGATVENTNPVELDSAGRPEPGGSIWVNGAYKFVLTDADGNVISTTDNVSSFTEITDSAEAYFESFSGTGSQTAFTLAEDLGTDEKTVMVFVNDESGDVGFDIQPPTAYTLSGTTLTFASAPPSGTNNVQVWAPSLQVGAAAASAEAADNSATAAGASAAGAQLSEQVVNEKAAIAMQAAGRSGMEADRAEEAADRAEAAEGNVDFTLEDCILGSHFFA